MGVRTATQPLIAVQTGRIPDSLLVCIVRLRETLGILAPVP